MSIHNLTDGIRRKSERNCNSLRTHENPPDVKVFKATPDWAHKFDLGEPVRTETPTNFIAPSFNGGKRGK